MKHSPGIADLIGVTGVGLLGFGTWQLSPPAAFIVVGMIGIVIAVMSARRA